MDLENKLTITVGELTTDEAPHAHDPRDRSTIIPYPPTPIELPPSRETAELDGFDRFDCLCFFLWGVINLSTHSQYDE
jgi:hypothetical protein